MLEYGLIFGSAPNDKAMRIALELVKYAIGALLGVGVSLLVAWYRHSLLPVIQSKVELVWEPTGFLHIRIKAENTSSVPAKVKESYLQILERTEPVEENQVLNDFVPFTKADWEKLPPEKRPEWREPYNLARPKVNQYVKPREVIEVEFLYRPSAKAIAVHCGFTVRPKSKLSHWLHGHALSFTTTAWATLPTYPATRQLRADS